MEPVAAANITFDLNSDKTKRNWPCLPWDRGVNSIKYINIYGTYHWQPMSSVPIIFWKSIPTEDAQELRGPVY